MKGRFYKIITFYSKLYKKSENKNNTKKFKKKYEDQLISFFLLNSASALTQLLL